MVETTSRNTLPRLQWSACPSPTAPTQRTTHTPQGTVVYAIGDIHACSDLLDTLLQGIEQDCAQRPRQRTVVVYLGDYLSRGTVSYTHLTLPTNREV